MASDADKIGQPDELARLAAENARLREQIAQLRAAGADHVALLDHAPDVFFLVDLDAKLRYASPSVKRFRGCTVEEALAEEPREGMTGESWDRVQAELAAWLDREARGEAQPRKPIELELEHRCKDGSTVWGESRIFAQRDEQGRLIGFGGVTRDITARRNALEQLARTEERYRKMMVTAPDGIILLDWRGRVTECNRAFCELCGYPEEAFVGRHITQMPTLRARDIPRFLKLFASLLLQGTREPFEFPWRHADGSERIGEARVARLQRGGRTVGLQGIVRDITETKKAAEQRSKLEAQVLQHQKLEAIGQLAGGVAHDLNNQLTPIMNFASLLKLDAQRGDEVHEAAEAIQESAERAAALSKQLLGFARRGKLREVAVDLNELVRGVTARLVEPLSAEGVEVFARLTPGAVVVRGDPGQLEQILVNLATNAREAMPDGGALELSTGTLRLDEAAEGEWSQLAPGRYAHLSVRDEGVGIGADLRHRVFEPFFTTKKDGAGSGMGLAVVYGIVDNHGGAIRVRSAPGEGSTVDVLLPVARWESQQRSRRITPVTLPASEGTLLVVDDEAALRNALRRVLQRLGYGVLFASNGLEAVEIYRERGAEIDVVLLDIVMPVMDGATCFRELRALDPQVKVILITGHALDGLPQRLLEEGVMDLVQKPFMPFEMAEAIERVLDRPA